MTTNVQCDPHYWLCGNRHKTGKNSTITPEHCRYCGAERDLIETWEKVGLLPARRYTEIRYPNGKPKIKEDTKLEKLEGQAEGQGGGEEQAEQTLSQESQPESKGKGGNTKGMRDYYQQNKEAILADYAYMGFSATVKKWNIPSGSMSGLLRRWGVETTKSKNRRHELGKGVLSVVEKGKRSGLQLLEEQARPLYKTTDIAEGNLAKSREIEAHAEEIIADIDSGMMIKTVCAKWDISRKALESFRKRHGMSVGASNKPVVDIVAIVDQIFDEETDIKTAKHRWYGAKSVIQMMRLR